MTTNNGETYLQSLSDVDNMAGGMPMFLEHLKLLSRNELNKFWEVLQWKHNDNPEIEKMWDLIRLRTKELLNADTTV